MHEVQTDRAEQLHKAENIDLLRVLFLDALSNYGLENGMKII